MKSALSFHDVNFGEWAALHVLAMKRYDMIVDSLPLKLGDVIVNKCLGQRRERLAKVKDSHQ